MTATCPLCAAPVLPDDATDDVLGMPTHEACAANEREHALVNGREPFARLGGEG